MKHAGLHIGNGQIMHCTNANGSPGVTTDTIANKTWTHYAIPIGLYTDEEIKNAEKVNMMNFTMLKRGSTGGAVVELQKKLNGLGYDCGTPDGNFGSKTDNAVRKFQADYNLKVDGIAGSTTLKKLEEITNSETKPVPSDDTPSIDTNKLLQLKAKLNEAIKIIDELI
jgi:peptidoglycan hydrolase-like protein with peptidoglycan-binding domain